MPGNGQKVCVGMVVCKPILVFHFLQAEQQVEQVTGSLMHYADLLEAKRNFV